MFSYRIVFSFLLLQFSSCFGQTNGFFGHNNLLEISSVSNVPLIPNVINALGNGEGIFGDWEYGGFNTGLRLSYGRINKRNRIISFEAGVDFLSFKTSSKPEIIRSYSFMPKIEFTGKNIMVPIGISNQLGLGAFSIFEDYEAPVYGVDLMYACILRSAVSKHLLLHYGLRLSLSFIANSDFIAYLPYDSRTYGDTQKRYNIASFDFGLTYLF